MTHNGSHDTVQAMRLRFNTPTEAAQFAIKQGWDFGIQEDQNPTFTKKSYSDNFKHIPGPLRFVKTK
jgi:hypothetical protein